ncbi:AUGMIN subunit 8-like [Zingiber officinale]|uniref:AUGMIN subunit 8-like n=1 Tax=Zingiber officinale TaxID=94328 RepID=UPI001C4DBF89|nr:AUGMIN subunit 8-like [Zingiber officinale]
MEKPTPPRRVAKSHPLPSPSSSPTASDRRRSSIYDASPKRRDSPAFAVLWPSSNRSQSQPSLSLADHLTHDRLRDLHRTLHPAGSSSPRSILRQRSYSEVDKRSIKKKQDPKGSRSPTIVGGSMRHLHLPPSPKSTRSTACAGAALTPSSALCSRSLSARRGKTSDLGLHLLSSDSSPTAAPSNSLSQGRRSGSASPEPRAAKGKSNGSFISLGLDLFRRKWKLENTTPSSPPPSSSPTSSGLKKNRAKDEAWHQLKLTSNRLIQWRWTNARSDRTYLIKTTRAEV